MTTRRWAVGVLALSALTGCFEGGGPSGGTGGGSGGQPTRRFQVTGFYTSPVHPVGSNARAVAPTTAQVSFAADLDLPVGGSGSAMVPSGVQNVVLTVGMVTDSMPNCVTPELAGMYSWVPERVLFLGTSYAIEGTETFPATRVGQTSGGCVDLGAASPGRSDPFSVGCFVPQEVLSQRTPLRSTLWLKEGELADANSSEETNPTGWIFRWAPQ